MFKFSHTTLIILSGIIWFAVGLVLLPLGLNILIETSGNFLHPETSKPILSFFLSFSSNKESAIILLIMLCLLIGYFKGRYVLGKSAVKGVERILSFPNPTHLGNIYSKKYYILLGAMVFMGILVKYLPQDIRGAVDVIIGSALINGAMIYFRSVFNRRVNLYS